MDDDTIVTSLDWSADEGSASGNLFFVPQVKQDSCEEKSFGARKERADDKPTSGTTRQGIHAHKAASTTTAGKNDIPTVDNDKGETLSIEATENLCTITIPASLLSTLISKIDTKAERRAA